MHRRDGLAEPVRLTGEVAAHLVGVQVALGEQVARAGGGHVPALGGVGRELGDHAERAGFVAHVVSYDPSSRATCGLPARASTRFSSMSGLMPGVMRRNTLKMASSSNTTLVLLCSAPDTRGAASNGSVTSGSLLKRTRHRADRRRRIDQRQQVLGGGRVVERVVGGAVPVRPDRRDVGVLLDRPGVPPHDHLIALRRAIGVGRRRAARGRGRREATTVSAGSAETSSRVRPAYQRCSGSHSRTAGSRRLMLLFLRAPQLEPVEPVARQGQQVRQLPDRRELDVPGHLDGRVPVPVLQVQLDRLREPRQVVHAQHGVALPSSAISRT